MWLNWDLCFGVSHRAVIKVSARGGVSSQEASTPKLMWLWAGFSFLQDVGLDLSSSWGLPWLLAVWSFPTCQLASSKYASWEGNQQDGIYTLLWPDNGSEILSQLPFLMVQKEVSQGKENTQGCEHQQAEICGDHLGSCPSHLLRTCWAPPSCVALCQVQRIQWGAPFSHHNSQPIWGKGDRHSDDCNW